MAWDTFRMFRIYPGKKLGSVRLIYKVVEKLAVRKVLIEGNDNVSDDDIKEVIDIVFTILRVQDKEKRSKIRDHLTEKGY